MLIRFVAAAKIAMDGATLPGCAHRVPQLGAAFQNRAGEASTRDLGQQLAPLRRQQACEYSMLETAAASRGVIESSRDETSSRRAVALWPVMRPVAVPDLISGSYFLDFESPAGFGATCTL